MSLKNPKLCIELIPKSCQFSNVRTTLKTKEWDKIRFISYEAAGHKCEICGDNGLNQGYKHRVECHEVWDYNNENHVQKLVKLISLCVVCHQVKHIGRAKAIGKEKDVLNQLSKVNKWTKTQIDEHIAISFEIYKERSKYQWILDLSILTQEPYNIVLPKNKKRMFEIKKYKKKRKKSKKKINRRPTKK